MKNQQEIRTLPALELRIAPVAADGTRTLTGRAIVFNQRSVDLGNFVEIVAPGAVAETLSSGQNVLLLCNHNTSQVLGSTRAKTLQLNTDSKGVSFSCKLDTRMSFANDLAISIDRGDTAGCSFGFRTLNDSYANDNGILVRTLNQIQLFELTVTSNPAYEQTQLDLRSVPKEFRDLFNFDDDDEDEDCQCPRDEEGNLLDPDNCDCPEELLEDRTAWAEKTLLRLELAERR